MRLRGQLGNRSPVSPLVLTLAELVREVPIGGQVVLFGGVDSYWTTFEGVTEGVVALRFSDFEDTLEDFPYAEVGLATDERGEWNLECGLFRPRHFALIPSSPMSRWWPSTPRWREVSLNDDPAWLALPPVGSLWVDDVNITCI